MRKIFFLCALCASVLTVNATEGALNGKFTINAAGDQIVFSKGNLQYIVGSHTWQFSTSQYGIMATSQSEYINEFSDLFGWGTGDEDYVKISKDAQDYATFTDWGVNKISNGGNEANLWRTLTKDEWVYLFYTRPNAATLFALGSVYGISGIILLPDNWTLPAGATFTASTSQGMTDRGEYYLDDDKGHYTDNTYSEEQWAVMEAAGAVFLPAAGYRDGTDVSNVILYGDYWSSTPDASDEPFSENRAYSFSFDSDGLYPQAYGDRFYGLSVRLVQAVPKPVQTKEMTPGIAHLSWDETNNLWSITVYDDNPDFAFVVTVSGEKGTLPTAVTISNSTEDANVFSYVKDPESFGGIIKDANLTITYDGNGIQNDGTDYYTNAKISGQMNDEFGNTLIVNEPADFINIFLPADITEGIESIQSSAVNKQKILRDGQLFIIRDGKTFSAQGIELRSDNQYK